jgi:ABC-type multidrug transport system fused ATPase/permease subunit
MGAPAERKTLFAFGVRTLRLAKKEVAWLAGMGRRNPTLTRLPFFAYALMAAWLPFAAWRIARRVLPAELRTFIELLFAVLGGFFALLIAASETFNPLLDLLGIHSQFFKAFALLMAVYKCLEAIHHGRHLVELLQDALAQKSKHRSAQLLIAVTGSVVLHGVLAWTVLHSRA